MQIICYQKKKKHFKCSHETFSTYINNNVVIMKKFNYSDNLWSKNKQTKNNIKIARIHDHGGWLYYEHFSIDNILLKLQYLIQPRNYEFITIFNIYIYLHINSYTSNSKYSYLHIHICTCAKVFPPIVRTIRSVLMKIIISVDRNITYWIAAMELSHISATRNTIQI